MPETPPRRKRQIFGSMILLVVVVLGWNGWRAYMFRAALKQAKALGWSVEYTGLVEAVQKNWKAAFARETWFNRVGKVMIPNSEQFEKRPSLVRWLNPRELVIHEAYSLRSFSKFSSLTGLQELRLMNCTRLPQIDELRHLPALETLYLNNCSSADLAGLEHCTTLKNIVLHDLAYLENVDALKSISSLDGVFIIDAPLLKNVDPLKSLPALRRVRFENCGGLRNLNGLLTLSTLKEVWIGNCRGLPKETIPTLKAALPNAAINSP